MDSIPILINEYDKIAKGKREIFRGISENSIELVLVACDADKLFASEITSKCAAYGILCETAEETRAQIGDLLKIAVPCAALGFYKRTETEV